jgi:hypothetical protein
MYIIFSISLETVKRKMYRTLLLLSHTRKKPGIVVFKGCLLASVRINRCGLHHGNVKRSLQSSVSNAGRADCILGSLNRNCPNCARYSPVLKVLAGSDAGHGASQHRIHCH